MIDGQTCTQMLASRQPVVIGYSGTGVNLGKARDAASTLAVAGESEGV